MGGGVTGALVAAALLGAGLFIAWERRATAPVVRIEAFADPGFAAALAANVAVFSVMVATLVVGPFYLARGAGLDAGMVGLVMAVGPVTSALTGIPAGRLVDRFGARRIAILGLGAMALGTAALALLPPMFGLAAYVAALVIVTPGYQLFQAANNTAVMAGVSQERRGVTSGMLTLSRNLGLITGAAALGAVFAAAAGTADMAQASAAQVEAGLRATFLAAAGLIACALAAVAAASAQTKRGGSAAPDRD
jgi:MFS family permease